MASTSPAMRLAPSIQATLAGLRRRIRAYIWLEGLSLAVIWVCLTFWIALALDYFPVLVWASEMPRPARAVILVVVAAVLAYILFRYILARAFVPISDRSLAVLLERQYDQFDDALVTSVELSARHDHGEPFSREMLLHTHDDALARVGDVSLGRVFNWRPLAAKMFCALALVGSIMGFYAISAPAFEIARDRLYFLQDIPWPRSAEIEVVSLEIQRPVTSEGAAATSQTLSLDDTSVKVAKGATALVRVRASSRKRIPETCSIMYRTADGDRGTVQMKKVGRVKGGYQYYTFDGKPFKGLLSDLTFDVQGHDHRVRGYTVEVVDSPALVETNLACTFPSYMVDEQLSLWLPREEPLSPATQLPVGTRIEVRCAANKPLRSVEVLNVNTQDTQTIVVQDSSDRFTLPLSTLASNLTLELTLLDNDGVLSDRPQRLFIAAVSDEAPKVNARLAGIGSLITPDAMIPVTGTIEDDYAVARAWFDVHIADRPPQEFPFALLPAGKLEQTIDFRELRSRDVKFALTAGEKLTLAVLGQDKHDLEGGPQTGFGDRWELSVVTPDELLSSLEARELGLRRRFEQIIVELTETRDDLIRAAVESKPPPAVSKSETAFQEENLPVEQADPAGASLSLRLLIAQRAVQQSQKSAQEILGVAASFADIRAELINNRVDTEERKTRLKEQITEPLEKIVKERFPELDRRLVAMQAAAGDSREATATVQGAIEEANEILLDCDAVLQRMLDLETYNELVDLVRSLIEEQEKIMSATKKKQAADLLK